MPVQSGGQAIRPRPRRRHKSSRRVLVISIVACALLLLSIPVAHLYLRRPENTEAAPSAGPAKNFDLVLAEVSLRGEGGQSYIGGVVENQSGRAYRDVQLIFALRNGENAMIGTATATVDRLAPRSRAPFRTPALPEGTIRFTVRDMGGNLE